MTNRVVHFEILGPDGPALIDFYRGLFGWDAADRPMPGWPHYGLVQPDGAGIGGAVGTADAAGGPTIVLYVEVDDPQGYVDRAVALGATVVLPVTELPAARVTVAWLRDPQGNVVGIVNNHQN